ncbi:MAG: extracellular solute-binding protein, partial [Chloroflexales bacterium]|nr:extracellular solute-binding protein [Chloroflexales bacterium]
MQYASCRVLLLSLTILLGACTFGGNVAPPSPITPSPEASRVTITFAAPEAVRHLYAPLITAFNTDNPSIDVRFVAQGDRSDMRQLVSAADTAVASLLQPADVFNGYLHDLTPLIEADPAFDRADFYPRAWQTATQDGGVYLLPRALHVEFLLYNQELWQQAGLPSPTPEWGWSGLMNAATQLAAQSTDSAPVYGLLDDTAGVRTLFGEFTATASDETDATDAAARLERDAARMRSAVERTMALVDSGVVYLDPAGVAAAAEAADIGQLIRDQRIGIWSVRASPAPLDSPDWPFALGIMAMPALRPPGLGESEGYIMSSGTQHPTEAWRWLAFLSQQSSPNLYPDPADMLFFPARPAVLEGSATWAQLDAETRATLEAALQRPGSASGSPPDSALLESMHQTLRAVVTDEAPLDQALRAAQANLAEHREQAQTPLPDSAPVVVATPAPIVTPPEGAT